MRKLRIGLVVPHIFMHQDILPQVIFSPGRLALDLAGELTRQDAEVTLYTPGPVTAPAPNVRNQTADLSYFERELAGRGDTYLDLLKKHPLTFITLARQVQSEIVAKAFADANAGQLDIVHIYTNEEDIALPFAQFCQQPVVFTHHDPFNFMVKYKNLFPKYKTLNWLSMSLAQRQGMPLGTNWRANIYHGLPAAAFRPNYRPTGDYVAYLGRIIEPKGLHLAIQAARAAKVKLKIAGKHYAGGKDSYWQEAVLPQLGPDIEYVGFIKTDAAKQEFLGNARALIIPSIFEEPFGMVMIEALACGTPLIGLKSGAIPEVIQSGKTGLVTDESGLAKAIQNIKGISRRNCRAEFEARFTLTRMAAEHLAAYQRLLTAR
jgi:glycosyltransferase involved in cell wall biosynthesis